MGILRGGCVAAVAALVAAGAGASAPSVKHVRNGLVVYASYRAVDSDGEQIYAITASGTGDRRLTHASGVDDWSPHWSPDGRSIAFTRTDTTTGVSSVFVITASGGGLRRVTDPSMNARSPSWSPDGKHLVVDAESGLAIVDLRTLAVKTLPVVGGSPAWSPSGRWIAYLVVVAKTNQIYRVRPDGSGAKRVTKKALLYGRPSWSPDSTRLVADIPSSTDTGPRVPDLAIVGLDGRQRTLRAGANATDPAWSPDGKRIVFSAEPAPRESDYDLYSMKATGGGIRPVTTDGAGSDWPDWQRLR